MNRPGLGGRWLLAAVAACLPLPAQTLTARLSNDHLRVAAPGLRFLTGKVLERLHDGAPVALTFQLSLSTEAYGTAWLRDVARFIISFDLWEEKFSVVRLGAAAGPVSNLSAEAAQALCLDALSLPVAGLAADKRFWLKLEGRTEDPKEGAGLERESGVSLARLVELFSRRPRGQQQRWAAQAGPLRLADLRKSSGRAR